MTADTGLPAIRGDRWFDTEHRPFVLRVEYPLTAEEMVAALYGTAEPGDITTDEDLCGSVAVTLSLEGLPGLAARASRLRHQEQHNAITSADFLATCRARVSALRHTRP
jgi:hypothetical protein